MKPVSAPTISMRRCRRRTTRRRIRRRARIPTARPRRRRGHLWQPRSSRTLTPLPAFATPSFRPDRKGGGTIDRDAFRPARSRRWSSSARSAAAASASACSRIQTDSFYTVVAHRAGSHALTLGRRSRTADAVGQKDADDLPQGTYQIYAVGADYPAYEASYPKNLSQLPLIQRPERSGRRHDLRSAQRVPIRDRAAGASSDRCCARARHRRNGGVRRHAQHANRPDGRTRRAARRQPPTHAREGARDRDDSGRARSSALRPALRLAQYAVARDSARVGRRRTASPASTRRRSKRARRRTGCSAGQRDASARATA